MRRVILTLLLLSSPLFAEEEIDLGSLGDAFTPYIVDRNAWWIVLPAISLAIVFAHLLKIQRPKTPPEDR